MEWLVYFVQDVKKMKAEFDLKKVYVKDLTPLEIAEIIAEFNDKKLRVYFIPTDKDKADVLIKAIPKIRKQGIKRKEVKDVKKEGKISL